MQLGPDPPLPLGHAVGFTGGYRQDVGKCIEARAFGFCV